jgi:NNP family nitrate/nitrite transporter-like MFS transporter
MPAFYNTLVSQYHLSPHWAWRDAFFLPFGLITAWAILLLLLCPDTPTGKWSERGQAVTSALQAEHSVGHVVPHSGVGEAHHAAHPHGVADRTPSDTEKGEKLSQEGVPDVARGEVVEVDAEYTHEVIQSPTFKEIVKVIISPQTLALMSWYFNSFGAELAVNAILGAYYLKVNISSSLESITDHN